MSATVAIATLGCRLNQVDSQDLAERLRARGYRVTGAESDARGPSRADVVVVNTCTVTGRADVSDRQAIRRAARRHPGARIVVTGCWAQTDPARVAALRDVDLVVGTAEKPRLPELIAELLGSARTTRARIDVSDVARLRILDAPPPATASGRARAFLKVQEGCQHRCAFCIVPFARGASRSLAPEVVLDRARALVALGHPELVLTGVDLGHYGADLTPRTSLAALLRTLVEVPGLRWVRLSSVLPAYFTPALLDVVTGSPRIAPHLHVPLQSGSDAVLRRMRRPYTVALYRALIEKLAAAIPGLGLGADVIVGFPGESDADFAATAALVEALPFSYLHVFGYSDRQGTAAAALGDRVDPRVVAERSRMLRALAGDKGVMFRRALVGTRPDVLVLEQRDKATGLLVGLTGNYVEVAFAGADAVQRTMTQVRVTAADAAGVRGELAA